MSFLIRPTLLAIILCLSTPLLAYNHHQSGIHWQDYSDAVLTQAADENKPIFMLISAVWCFNCHIYEEILNTPDVTAAINRDYIPAFVDYDRRQDVAREYPSAGIPITVILAPNGEYLVSVPGVIEQPRLLSSLNKTLQYLATEYQPAAPETLSESNQAPLPVPSKAQLTEYLQHFERRLLASFDLDYGGIGRAQKEPHADILLRLIALDKSGDQRWRELLLKTLDGILNQHQSSARPPKTESRPDLESLLALRDQQTHLVKDIDQLQIQHRINGLYDPIEGGFFRYATRRDWSIPHFEKMLFENALLAEVFLRAAADLQQPHYQQAAQQSLTFLLDQLFDNHTGQFFGSLPADEVYYHLTREERQRVTPPPPDRTSYAVPSAQALMTLLHAQRLLDEPKYLSQASKAADFLMTKMIGEQGAYSYYDPNEAPDNITTRPSGQLRDTAWLAEALLMTYQATHNQRYLAGAKRLLQYASDKLVFKAKDIEDQGQMAKALLRAYDITKDTTYQASLTQPVSYFFNEVQKGNQNTNYAVWHQVITQLLAADLPFMTNPRP